MQALRAFTVLVEAIEVCLDITLSADEPDPATNETTLDSENNSTVRKCFEHRQHA